MCDRAMLPGLASPWTSEWVNLLPSVALAEDVGVWPYSVGILVKWVAFLGTLHWHAARANLGVGSVSYVEMLVLHELWACERLVLEKALTRYQRPGPPISVSAVRFGPGIDVWRSCRYIGARMRSLCTLPVVLVGLCFVQKVLQTSAHWVGKMWSWTHCQAQGDGIGGLSE